MKIKENKESKVAPKFEPFSFTMEVQTEEELIELFHRFDHPSIKLLKLYDNGIPPKWNFVSNNCDDVRRLLGEKIQFHDIKLY